MNKWLYEFCFVMAPKILGGAGTFVLNILLLHFFVPEQYGAYSLCVAGIMLADGILGAALDLGVLRLAPLWRTDKAPQAQAIQIIVLYLKLFIIAALLPILWFFAARIRHDLFSDHVEISWLFLSAAAILGVLLLRSVQTYFQVEGKFSAYGKLELFHFFVKFTGIAVALALGYANPGVILAFYGVAPLGIVALFFAFSWKRFFDGREMLSIPLLMELLQFVKWFLVVNGISVIIVYLPNLLLTRLADLREVGIYSAGQTLASVFPMLGAYLAILISPKIMTYCRQGRYYFLFLTAQKLLIAGAVLLYLFFLLYFDFISRKLLPPHYAGSREVFMVLLPSALCWLVSVPLNVNFVLFVRPKFIVIMEAAIFPLLFFSYYWFIPAHGALGAAWVTTIFGLIRSGIIQIAAWKWARKMPVTSDGDLIVLGDSMLALDPSKRID